VTTPTPRVDGRTARAERTRKAIVDAHVTLITSGDLRPTADRIAKTAGVSLRALWSHFADMEALFSASAQRILDQRDQSFTPIPAELPLAERIERYCARRARINEAIGPAARASALKEPFSPALQRFRRHHLERIRDEAATLFAAEIGDDKVLLDAVVAVVSFNTWDTMRNPMELAVDDARNTMRRAITALLGSGRGA